MSLNLTNWKIAVLMGGPGSERLVSLKSGEGVVGALESLGAIVTPVVVDGPGFALPADAQLAFNVIHGTYGEDGQLQRELERRGLPYTGEGVAGSELAIDKIATKKRLIERGVPTAKFEIIKKGQAPILPLPFVIKAPREGSSVGVYIVRTGAELEKALTEAWRFGDELLVEQFITGRELTVGVVGELALPVVEIVAKQDFYNFENKYTWLSPNAAGADHYCPARLSPEITSCVQAAGFSAHRALGLEVYSRVDILVTDAGEPFVLEVNTIPGMTPSSLLPEAAQAVGIGYAELCRRIAELSLTRFSKQPE